ncbi:hypothetical protein CQ018_01610 [Arthrobacter sp. MYb227]|uniref:hypothetical protein n=1 Tax=Arthrobacter sp. MYb227 TaxID=1848601 RepID=UPI000CFB62A9|nr:hypothetical protein [Arthrobacter sp. MYb227]PQZ96010.1 hypothetical protein CQ018_01610 [Arthrobacter sp. MYb227]
MEQQQQPGRKKPRRVTAQPQQVSESVLLGVFELPHGAGRPDPKNVQLGDQPVTTDAAKDSTATPTGSPDATDKPARTAAQGTEPIFSERAAEDDPRRWGDGVDDLGEWMKSQRPPHWD